MPPLTREREVLALLQTERSVLVVNTSGGKDSDAMLTRIWAWMHRHHIASERLYVITADLQRNEWSFARPHIVTFTRQLTDKDPIVVTRPQGDVLQMWEDRYQQLQAEGRTSVPHWSSAAHRYCTASAKRAQIQKAIIRLFPQDRVVINCVGLRAEESPRRRKAQTLKYHPSSPTAVTRNRHVYTWLPIHAFTLTDVWETLGWTPDELRLLQADVRQRVTPGDYAALETVCQEWGYHWGRSYALSNTRLSCALCVLANQGDLRNGIAWNPDHFRAISELERRSGFSFQPDQWLSDLGIDYLSPSEREALDAAKTRHHALRHPNQPKQLRLI
jgi:3'-phosphoadenosine 5'-phosphosulfate sulfotransferase (PAPS reductase)/FAD synthetase